MADPTELAYFAGFFDGEGCVAIYPGKYVASIANTDVRPLRRAQELWGGYISMWEARARRYAVQDLWHWQIYGHSARPFLEAIRPFMMLKGEQVDVYLATLDVVLARGQNRNPGANEVIAEGMATLRRLKRGA